MQTLPAPPSAGAAMDQDHIYVPLKDGTIVALDRKTGDTAWQTDMSADWPLVASNGVVYVGDGQQIRALDADSGNVMWQIEQERPVAGPLRVQGSLLIALMTPDDVFAYRLTDGHAMWRHSLGGTAGTMRMTANDEGVFVTAPQGRLVALSLADGHPLWEARIPGMLSPPAAARQRVFVGSSENVFYAFNSRNGHLQWKWRTGGDVVGATADRDAAYFVSLDNILRAVNRGNGNQRWQKDTGTRPVAAPQVIGPVVVVPGVAATLSAFSVMTGAAVGTFTPPATAELELEGEPMFDPVLQPFQVAAAILTRDGRLIALRPTGMMFREAAPAPFTQLPGRVLDKERLPPIASEDSATP